MLPSFVPKSMHVWEWRNQLGTCKNPDKGDDSADKRGGCCQAGGEDESEGGTGRWRSRKTLYGHKFLSPPKSGVAHVVATAVEEMEERVCGDWGGGCSRARAGNPGLKYGVSVRGEIHGGTPSGHAD